MSNAFRSSALLAAVSLLGASRAIAQTPPPAQPTAITAVRLIDDVDAPQVTILLRNGRIEEVLQSGTEPPEGYLRIDGGGGLAVPAFVDAYTTAGVKMPQPTAEQDAMSPLAGNVHVGMREANRKGLQPSLDALSVLELSDDELEQHRAQGFAVLHSSPSGELLAGLSAVISAREGALRERVLAREVYLAAAFSASGSGYPGTLMGYLSHLRQFILDAKWHALRQLRHASGLLDRRPPYDPELEAMSPVIAKERTLLCRAETARDIRRWLAFAAAQDMRIAICGGREAWKVAPELRACGVRVLLSLDWGDEVEDPDEEPGEEDAPEEEVPPPDGALAEKPELAGPDATDLVDGPPSEEGVDEPQAEGPATAEEPDDWTYAEPIDLRRERRRLWEERRDCALRLEEAGVAFAFGSAGGQARELLEHARELVEAGLPEAVALAAMTTRAAEALGLERSLGKIEAGYDADIAIWSASPFTKNAKLERLIVDGRAYEYEDEGGTNEVPAEGVDLTGTWEVTYAKQTGAPAELELDMQEDGALVGTLTFEMPDGTKSSSELTGHLGGHDVTLSGSVEMGTLSAKIRIEGRVEGDGFSGDATWKFSGGEDSNSFEARRKPERRETRSTDTHSSDTHSCDRDDQ